MRRALLLTVLLMACLWTPYLSASEKVAMRGAGGYADIKYPPLEFKPVKPEKVTLSNGMVLLLLENHELPIVEVVSMVKVGSLYEPLNKRGLTALLGSTWRAGGTVSMKPGELDEKLEFIAASIETSIGDKAGSISMSVMKKDLDEGLRALADLIMNPAFDKERFKTAKQQMLEAIKRENDDPETIAEREFMRAVFPEYPSGIPPTIKSVESIDREDVAAFYKDHIGPESFMFGITGDFDRNEIVTKFEGLLKDMKPAAKKLPSLPEFPSKIEPGVFVVDKKLQQAVIRSGHLGVDRNSPDYHTVIVMNYVLGGGGFSSRLMQEIRSFRGLAYSIWSYYSGGRGDRGVFMLGGETKNETAFELIDVSGEIMRDIAEKGVTKEELAMAKEAMVNSFIFTFEKDERTIQNYLNMEYYGMPPDYLDKFRDNINAVMIDDVKKAASRYLEPGAMVIVAVGDATAMGDQMKKLGDIKEIELEK